MKNSNPNGKQAAAASTSSTEATKAAKPSLSEQQRTGAVERALEAVEQAGRIAGSTKDDHAQADLIRRAVEQVSRFADDAVVAGSVADAQYSSRKAVEAVAAASWLYGQR